VYASTRHRHDATGAVIHGLVASGTADAVQLTARRCCRKPGDHPRRATAITATGATIGTSPQFVVVPAPGLDAPGTSSSAHRPAEPLRCSTRILRGVSGRRDARDELWHPGCGAAPDHFPARPPRLVDRATPSTRRVDGARRAAFTDAGGNITSDPKFVPRAPIPPTEARVPSTTQDDDSATDDGRGREPARRARRDLGAYETAARTRRRGQRVGEPGRRRGER